VLSMSSLFLRFVPTILVGSNPAAAMAAAPANISMITITILMMITKTMRETEMIPITATMLMMMIERIVMRKTKKRRINVTMRTAMEYVKPRLLRTL